MWHHWINEYDFFKNIITAQVDHSPQMSTPCSRLPVQKDTPVFKTLNIEIMYPICSKPLTLHSWLWYALMHFLQFLQPTKKIKKKWDHNYFRIDDFDPTGDRLQRFTKLCVSAAVNNFFFCSKLKWRSLHRREHFSAYLWRRFTKLILTCWWYVYLQLFSCLTDDFLSHSPSDFIFDIFFFQIN